MTRSMKNLFTVLGLIGLISCCIVIISKCHIYPKSFLNSTSTYYNSTHVDYNTTREDYFKNLLYNDHNIYEALIPVSTTVEELTTSSVPPDIKKILDRGRLIVGIISEERAPFIMYDHNNNPYGFDIDTAKSMAQSLGVDVEFNKNAKTFEELFNLVLTQEVDAIISKFSTTPERAKYAKFSNPYITLRQALLVNKIFAAQNKIENHPVEFLKESTCNIGFISGTSYAEYSKMLFQNATLVGYPDWNSTVSALVNNNVSAVLYDENEAVKLVRQKPEVALYVSIYILTDKKDFISIALPWQYYQLSLWTNNFMNTYDIQTSVEALIKEFPDVYSP